VEAKKQENNVQPCFLFLGLTRKLRDSNAQQDFAKKVRVEDGVGRMLQALTLSHSGEEETKILHVRYHP